jgi:hypothetical protein
MTTSSLEIMFDFIFIEIILKVSILKGHQVRLDPINIQMFSQPVNYAPNVDDRKSCSIFVLFLNKGQVAWENHKQETITVSMTA